MLVRQLVADLCRDFGEPYEPTSTVSIRFKANIQKAHTAILREPSLSRLRDTSQPLTFVSVVNHAFYGLPAQLARIYSITERDNDRELAPISLGELRRNDPGLTATGTPWAFIPLGYGPTKLYPSGTGLWVASSSASDTTQTIKINGIRTGGILTGDVTAMLNGVTRVAIGTFTDYQDIQSIGLNSTGVGLISIYDAAVSGNSLADIPISAMQPRYFRVQLYPTATGTTIYYVDGLLNVPLLDDNTDVPMLPEDFHDLLPSYARQREYERIGDAERMNMAAHEYEKGMNRLKYYVQTQPAELPVMGRIASRRYSRLGPWYPSDFGGW